MFFIKCCLVQSPEPAVDFDTVANVKQQHEVNVGKILNNPMNDLRISHFSHDKDHNLDS